MRFRHVILLGTLLLLPGCITAELNHNALDLASTVGDLQTSQVIENLGRFIDNPDAIPAQTVLISGTVTVINSLDPALAIPLSLPSRFARGFSVSQNNQWSENWNMLPVTDAGDIRRLRALYRFAVYGGMVGGKPSPERPGPRDFVAGYFTKGEPAMTGWWPKPFSGTEAPDTPGLLHTGWLYWTDNPHPAAPDQPARPEATFYPLGRSNGHFLFTTDRAAWGDFIVAVQAATPSSRAWALRTVDTVFAPP